MFRTMSDSVTSSERLSTMAWLGGWPINGRRKDSGGGGGGLMPPRTTDLSEERRVRRTSCKGIESAMAGGLGKVWYDS